MNRNDTCYQNYVKTLKEELRPAMGCTEPIAIAYAAAKARAVLGAVPERLLIEVSGNIIKNVKSVVVPHTGGLRGIPAAAAAGIVGGDADAELEVLSKVTPEQIAAMPAFLEQTPIEVRYAETGHIFDIMVTVYHGEDTACCNTPHARGDEPDAIRYVMGEYGIRPTHVGMNRRLRPIFTPFCHTPHARGDEPRKLQIL